MFDTVGLRLKLLQKLLTLLSTVVFPRRWVQF